MEQRAKSIRPFIGALHYDTSRSFYRNLGFEERIIDPKMSLFLKGELGFYLQDYYAKEWIENTMIFLEVEDVDGWWNELSALDLPSKYEGAKLMPVRQYDWGRECFLIDPSGVLWHIGQFA